MNLLEMANSICTTVNHTETEDVAACKGYLTNRHGLLWNEFLWKDSLVEYLQTISATYSVSSTWLPAAGVLLAPSIIQRVLAVRTDTRHLNIQRPEFYYCRDFDSFGKQGLAAEYILLPPCVWQFDTEQSLVMTIANTSDVGTTILVDSLNDADYVSVIRNSIVMALVSQSVGLTTRIDSISKQVTQGTASLSISAVGGGAITITTTVDALFFLNTVPSSFGAILQHQFAGTSGSATGFTYVSADGLNFTAIPGGFSGTITYNGTSFTFTSDALAIVTLAATDTAAAKRQRIKLVQIPATSNYPITLRVLGKRTVPNFTADGDLPAINGCDNTLLAFGRYDMLLRDRQYGRAATMLQTEIAPLLEQLKRQETIQQANNVRLQPQDGASSEALVFPSSLSPLTF